MAVARSFRTENIRNVVVLGHGGSGKTTLIDAVCFAAGTSRRKGNVNAGTALTMTTPEETGHGMSMQLTVAHAINAGTKINFLDTPGYMDFAGEAAAAVRVNPPRAQGLIDEHGDSHLSERAVHRGRPGGLPLGIGHRHLVGDTVRTDMEARHDAYALGRMR